MDQTLHCEDVLSLKLLSFDVYTEFITISQKNMVILLTFSQQ